MSHEKFFISTMSIILDQMLKGDYLYKNMDFKEYVNIHLAAKKKTPLKKGEYRIGRKST